MLTREEIQMSEQQFTDFLTRKFKNCQRRWLLHLQNENVTGEGVITRYEILPGIELFYNDFT